VTRRVGHDTNTTGFAGTVEMCFATGPIRFRKYSIFMRYVIDKIAKLRDRLRILKRDKNYKNEQNSLGMLINEIINI